MRWRICRRLSSANVSRNAPRTNEPCRAVGAAAADERRPQQSPRLPAATLMRVPARGRVDGKSEAATIASAPPVRTAAVAAISIPEGASIIPALRQIVVARAEPAQVD
jgi:hypothetical protein